jgi:hypothetical protein
MLFDTQSLVPLRASVFPDQNAFIERLAANHGIFEGETVRTVTAPLAKSRHRSMTTSP